MESFKRIFKILRFLASVVIVGIVALILVQRFSNNKISIAGIRIFTVVTESMVPKYQVGDVLLVMSKDPDTINVGEDVAYQGEVGDYADKVITHQVIKITKLKETDERTFITKGIANENEDPSISGRQIYGTVVRKLYLMSYLNGIINNNYGMYFLIVIPLAIIIFTEMKAFKEDREEIHREELAYNERDYDDYDKDYYDDDYDDRYYKKDYDDGYDDRYYKKDYDDDYDDRYYKKDDDDDYYDDKYYKKAYDDRYEEKSYNDDYNDKDYKRVQKRKEKRDKRRRKYND